MAYPIYALIAVSVFGLVHLWAEKIRYNFPTWHKIILSGGGGVAIAYVFVDLLPKLSDSDAVVKAALWQFFPYFERHAYVMALVGFLLFFIVDRSQTLIRKQSSYFLLSLSSYALFNFLVGYAVVDKNNPEVQPLVLFSIAMSLHYFMNDFALCEAHGDEYRYFGKWVLIACLFLGWLAGVRLQLSETAVALVSAFIGGGVIMNVTRHELPEENPHSLKAFLFAAFLYSVVLLSIGGVKEKVGVVNESSLSHRQH